MFSDIIKKSKIYTTLQLSATEVISLQATWFYRDAALKMLQNFIFILGSEQPITNCDQR